DECAAVLADEVGEGVERIHDGRHLHHRSRASDFLHVRTRGLETSPSMSESTLPMLEEKDFDREVLAADLPVLVDFGAEWCGPCRALEPVLEKIISRHAGKVRVVRVDPDRSAAIAA